MLLCLLDCWLAGSFVVVVVVVVVDNDAAVVVCFQHLGSVA